MAAYTGIKEILKEHTERTRHDCFATCSTASSTAAKVAVLQDVSHFELTAGVRIVVKFTNQNTATSPSLNIQWTDENGDIQTSGAITIRKFTSPTSAYLWKAGETISFDFDGTYWQIASGSISDRLLHLENNIYNFYVAGGTISSASTSKYISTNSSSTPITLTHGKTIVRVTFSSDCYSTVQRSSSSVSNVLKIRIYTSTTYTDIPIVYYRNGKYYPLGAHKITAGISDRGYYYWLLNSTTIELLYLTGIEVTSEDGTVTSTQSVFLVRGNPKLISYNSESISYAVYADGLIEQWGVEAYLQEGTDSVSYPCPYQSTPNCEGHIMSNSSDSPQYRMNCYNVSNTNFSFYAFKGSFAWIAKGY